jgi:hypothetical protein
VAWSGASYSFDQYTYGYSNNAAAGSSTWGMSSSLFAVPSVQGMGINGVIYRYTATKDPADPFTVSVQNEDALNGGYVFRETDDWSGRPGATINKLVPLPSYIPIDRWGTGSIETTGVGSVEDPSVVYTYKIDHCFDPQNDPSCPGYEEPYIPAPVVVEVEEIALPEEPEPSIDLYDAYRDELIQQAMQRTDPSLYERDEEPSKDKEGGDDEGALETALAASESALEMAVGQLATLKAMNTVSLGAYYSKSIPGGVYPDSLVLVDAKISDNRRAFRSLANDRLHSQMVGEQYK